MTDVKEEIPAGVKALADQIENHIREGFGKDQLLAMAHIQGIDGRIDIVACPFDTDGTKDMFSYLVKKRCRELAAPMVGFFSETWTFNNEDDYRDYKANEKKYKGSFGNHPKASELIMISVETHKGSFMSVIPILKNRKLGETRPLSKMDGHSGRMKFL
jgi:hypothetical protein